MEKEGKTKNIFKEMELLFYSEKVRMVNKAAAYFR